MNRTPLNAIPLNGNIYVPMGGAALIEAVATLPILYGVGLTGQAQAQFASTLDLYKRSRPGVSTASIVLQGDGDGFLAPHIQGEGEASVATDGSLSANLYFGPSLHAPIVFDGANEGYPATGHQIIGTAPIEFYSELESNVRAASHLEGIANIHVDTALTGQVGRTHRPSLSATFWIAPTAYANLQMSTGGDAKISVDGELAPSFGGKLPLAGRVSFGLHGRLAPDWWRHVYGSATSEIKIEAKAGLGYPPIPGDYVPAHPNWRLVVGADDWKFVVPKDRRLT